MVIFTGGPSLRRRKIHLGGACRLSSGICDSALQFLFIVSDHRRRNPFSSIMAQTHPSMTKLNAQGIATHAYISACPVASMHERHVQIRLGDIEDGIPCVKALLDKGIEILCKSQLHEYSTQFSHTAGLILAHATRNEACRVLDRRIL